MVIINKEMYPVMSSLFFQYCFLRKSVGEELNCKIYVFVRGVIISVAHLTFQVPTPKAEAQEGTNGNEFEKLGTLINFPYSRINLFSQK